MSNTMAAHEPINYLDSVLHEEEKRCEYGHQWRQFTISRSGRFKSKNKKRELIDGKMFDQTNGNQTNQNKTTTTNISAQQIKPMNKTANINGFDGNKSSWSNNGIGLFKDDKAFSSNKSFSPQHSATANKIYNKQDTYKSFYETNF